MTFFAQRHLIIGSGSRFTFQLTLALSLMDCDALFVESPNPILPTHFFELFKKTFQ